MRKHPGRETVRGACFLGRGLVFCSLTDSKEAIFMSMKQFPVIDMAATGENIRRLRLKIESNPASPQYIETVWGYGYKWDA